MFGKFCSMLNCAVVLPMSKNCETVASDGFKIGSGSSSMIEGGLPRGGVACRDMDQGVERSGHLW